MWRRAGQAPWWEGCTSSPHGSVWVCKLWCVCKRSRRLPVMCTSSLSWHSAAASAVQAACTHTHSWNTNTERTMNTIGEVINWVSSVLTIRFSSCFLICFICGRGWGGFLFVWKKQQQNLDLHRQCIKRTGGHLHTSVGCVLHWASFCTLRQPGCSIHSWQFYACVAWQMWSLDFSQAFSVFQ